MRISWILPEAEYAGGIRVISIYSEQLIKRGHQVKVISTPRAQPTFRRRLRTLFRERRWLEGAVKRATYFDELCIDHEVLDSARPVTDADVPDGDIVIATWWETAEPVNRLSASKGVKVYLMQDYGAPGMELEELVPTWQLPLYMITISQFLVDLVHEHVPGLPVDVIQNSVDQDLFQAPPRTKAEVPTVGFLYRVEAVKGSDIVLEAVEIARLEIPNLRFLAYGPRKEPGGRPPPEGMEYIYFPENSELKDIYASCDAWLFASRREGFGLPILEAMACRTPVIATPAGAAPELVNARGGGVMVDHEDPAEMARAIVRFCTMEETEWKEFSDAAHETTQSYTWDDAGDVFEASLVRAFHQERDQERDQTQDEPKSPATGRYAPIRSVIDI